MAQSARNTELSKSWQNMLYTLFNRAAAGGRGSSSTRVFFSFFSFVGDLAQTSVRPNAGGDFQSRNL